MIDIEKLILCDGRYIVSNHEELDVVVDNHLNNVYKDRTILAVVKPENPAFPCIVSFTDKTMSMQVNTTSAIGYVNDLLGQLRTMSKKDKDIKAHLVRLLYYES